MGADVAGTLGAAENAASEYFTRRLLKEGEYYYGRAKNLRSEFHGLLRYSEDRAIRLQEVRSFMQYGGI